MSRVPEIVLWYWVLKIASTTLGETGADMFSMTFNLGYGLTIALFMGVFMVFFAWKMYVKRYAPYAYWLTFSATAIVGTAISDYIDRTLGLGYVWGSLLLFALLLLTLLTWYLKEKSLAVEHITTASAESFYWLAFLIANTLGTAAGDFLADYLGLGFLTSALLITSLLIALALLHYFTHISRILLFWCAFVLTRPFGATFGDLLTKPLTEGGLNLGTMGTSLVFALLLFFALLHEVKQHKQKSQVV